MIIDVNHFNQKYQINPKKNMLHESARITNVMSAYECDPFKFDALIVPGSNGNNSNFKLD